MRDCGHGWNRYAGNRLGTDWRRGGQGKDGLGMGTAGRREGNAPRDGCRRLSVPVRKMCVLRSGFVDLDLVKAYAAKPSIRT